MDGKTNLGTYIRRLRESKKLGVNQLATYSGISAAQISRIETGERKQPRPETIAKLAQALKIPYEVLMEKAGYINQMDQKSSEDINTAFYDFDGLSEEEKEYLERQLEIFRDLKNKKRK